MRRGTNGVVANRIRPGSLGNDEGGLVERGHRDRGEECCGEEEAEELGHGMLPNPCG